MDGPRTAFRPPTMAYATLASFLDDLASRPLPPQIDRSMMASKSGTDQKNLLQALADFALIRGDQNQVTPELAELAEADAEARKSHLAKLIRTYYPAAVAVSEANGTHQQLQEVFRDQLGLNGSPDTRRKAITFFLHAARAADLHVSPHFPATRSGSGTPGTNRTKRTGRPRKPATAVGDNEPPPAQNGGTGGTAFSTEVQIKAGRVTLTVDVNPIELRGEDRKFFYDLVDRMEDYAMRIATTPTTSGEATPTGAEGGVS